MPPHLAHVGPPAHWGGMSPSTPHARHPPSLTGAQNALIGDADESLELQDPSQQSSLATQQSSLAVAARIVLVKRFD